MAPGNLDALGNLKVIFGTGATSIVTQPTAANLNATVIGTGTFAVQAAQSGTWNINNITGTISLMTGAATSANQTSQITQETATATVLGTTADSVCGTATGTCTMAALIKFLNTAATASLPAGTAIVGKVGIDQTTPGTTNAVQVIPGTSGGLTVSTFEPAASDNHTNLKNGAGQLYWVTAFNNSATINYLRFYNAATGFNGCNSATNLVAVAHIPANTSDAGFVLHVPEGIPFSTGISYCVVSAYGQATTTNATASAMDINIGYK